MRLFLMILLLICAPLAWTQEAEDSDATPPDAAEPAEDAATDAEDPDDGDVLDELYPLEDDDEFIPSEDVAFGQSIPFPTDI